MPFAKYRPWKQFGRYNTRILKNAFRRQNNQDMPSFYVDPEVVKAGIKIEDSLNPNFFSALNNETQFTQSQKLPSFLQKPSQRDHPLFNETVSYVFEGKCPMTDGIDEACALIKSAPAKRFPDAFFSLPDHFLPIDFAAQAIDAIMHGERYDPTLDQLPKRHDPILFWVRQERLHGIPVVKRNNIIMHNLYRKILFLVQRSKPEVGDVRFDFDAPISGYLPSTSSGFSTPFVLRQQPYLTVQSYRPLTLLADEAEIQATRREKVPNIYPISPHIDLDESQIYNTTALVPRQCFSQLHLHTIFLSRMQNQKYPWTTEQNAANAILNGFGAAVAQSTRNAAFFNDDNFNALRDPVLVKAVQLVDGRLDMVAVQLNTKDLSRRTAAGDDEADGEVKNIVWLEKGAQLYRPKPFYENMDEVRDFNFETVKKLVAFLLYH